MAREDNQLAPRDGRGALNWTGKKKAAANRGRWKLRCHLHRAHERLYFAALFGKPMTSAEIHIWPALQKGDRAVYEMVFHEHYRPLCAFARTFLTDPDEAEEVVQNVFVALWEKRNTLEVEASLRSYLFRSVRNACLNRLKHDKVRLQHRAHALYSASADSVFNHVDMQELESRLKAALDKLPEQCRKVFELSRFQEMRYAEIADHLQISPKTVENHMGKALKILREELHDYLPLVILLLLHDRF